MIIRITKRVPVETRHGIFVGSVRETVDAPPNWNPVDDKGWPKPGVWVMGDGEPVRILPDEYEEADGE